MISFLSVLTSVKDYVEITHKIVEADPGLFQIKSYDEIGTVLTFFILSIKEFLVEFFTLNWIKNFWSLPIIVPDIASAMISEISILDGSLHNAFNFLETPLAYGQQNFVLHGFEKFFIGFINSLFLVLPTSAAHVITLRRFVMQGVEIGYLAGLGTIAGNMLWLSSIIFGWRFFIIPWLSFDIFRYLFGFVLLVKYLWDCTKEQKMTLEEVNKSKIFLLNFLLAFTEQTCIYPFLSNISISPEASLLETFPADTIQQFIFIHATYLFGIFFGSYSFLLFSCWFWEYPAFTIYLWIQTKSNYRFTTRFYYKILNYVFTYLTMLAAISSIPYYGLDYSITKPFGFVPQDRLMSQKPSLQNRSEYEKLVTETSFLDIQPTNINLRTRDGQRPRRERWKQRFIKYEALDVSTYDQGVYDFLTIEDLNYGFDRFWFKRKMRNHTTYFRLFPSTWMITLKKQLLGSTKEARRNDFFTLLFEQYYHPNFHKMNDVRQKPFQALSDEKTGLLSFMTPSSLPFAKATPFTGSRSEAKAVPVKGKPSLSPRESDGQGLKWTMTSKDNTKGRSSPQGLREIESIQEKQNKYQYRNAVPMVLGIRTRADFSALRKFVRKFNTRIKTSEIILKNSKHSSQTLSAFSTTRAVPSPFTGVASLAQRASRERRASETRLSQNKLSLAPQKHLEDEKGDIVNGNNKEFAKTVYSKRWKHLYSNIWRGSKKIFTPWTLRSLSRKVFLESANLKKQINLYTKKQKQYNNLQKALLRKANDYSLGSELKSTEWTMTSKPILISENFKKTLAREKLSKKDRQILRFRTQLYLPASQNKAISFKVRTLLHPLKFYLQKEESFRRKLKFYGSAVFRKFSIGNNAPYFRTIMKRGFYYYKKNLRLKRTENVAALRPGLRKTFRTPRKLVKTSAQKITEETYVRTYSHSGKDTYVRQNDDNQISGIKGEESILVKANLTIMPSGHYNSDIGKRSSRYRFQIYKDVLQHWYYTPFNRLLLRFDIDAFINRQPKNHFLTKKEEQLLHLRRILLGEHYDTLRWYNFMQHYRSMKTRLGGTKSFASRTYNQQFQGTFKKIRHLFAITPSQTNISGLTLDDSKELSNKMATKISKETPIVLKFDQPLYNEYINSNIVANKQSGSILEKSILHEELFVPANIQGSNKNLHILPFSLAPPRASFGKQSESKLSLAQRASSLSRRERRDSEAREELALTTWQEEQSIEKTQFEDLITKSTTILGEYLLKTEPAQKEYIKQIIRENKYSELLRFLYLGKKENSLLAVPVKGKVHIVDHLRQKMSPEQKDSNHFHLNFENTEQRSVLSHNGKYSANRFFNAVTQELWVQFMRQSKKRINNRKFIKKYIDHRVIKREKRILRKQENLEKRLQQLKIWLIPISLLDYLPSNNLEKLISTRGIEKTFKKGALILENKIASSQSRNESFTFKRNKEIEKFRIMDLGFNRGETKNTVADSKPTYIIEVKKTLSKIGLVAFKAKTALKSITKIFIEKAKPLYFFLKHRPERPNLWKKRQKVKAKAKKQRKIISEKSIPKQLLAKPMNRNNIVYYDKWVLQEIISTRIPKQNRSEEPYEYARSAWTREGYEKLIPRFKELESINIFKKFINQTLQSKVSIFREYKRKTKKQKRSEYYPSYFYHYNSNKLRKIKWINKQNFKDKYSLATKDSRIIAKNKKLRILKNGGLLHTLISKVGLAKEEKTLLDLSHPIKETPSSMGYELTSLKTNISKKNQSRKKKKRKRKFSIKVKYQKSINKRAKFQKRNIYRKSKLKIFGKQLKHIKSNIQLQIWWWQTYLPKFQLDFDKQFFSKGRKTETSGKEIFFEQPKRERVDTQNLPFLMRDTSRLQSYTIKDGGQNVLNNVYKNILLNKDITFSSKLIKDGIYPETASINSLPFYAGWDESSRKLVVTNRLLSRRDAGLNFQNLTQFNNLKPLAKLYKQNEFEFQTPSKMGFGLNEASFLYWENEMLFTPYNIEQYNTNVISFFAPIGWRRFEFRHTILKTWLNFAKSKQNNDTKGQNQIKNEIINANQGPRSGPYNSSWGLKINCIKNPSSVLSCSNIPENNLSGPNSIFDKIKLIQSKQKKTSQKFRNRRIKKRYKRVKLAASTFVFKTQGPLLTDILPSHYLSVFNSQYRLPRHRYLKYKLINNTELGPLRAPSSLNSTSEFNNFFQKQKTSPSVSSFTLRKRSKPRRKFHRKRLIKSGGLIFPRRRKFINNPIFNVDNSEQFSTRWRPSSETDFTSNQPKIRVKTDTIRRRKARRKMFKQVYKPIKRFQPRFGGYTWPGDYPRLVWTDLPRLELEQLDNLEKIRRKQVNKEKRRLGMVGDLPHKYLLKKHNVIVLKKKLEKAQRSNKIRERVQELKQLMKK
uniref:Hypothetical chloroplast RF1 n=1 Tax=Oogamochlamys gigantea TaxID=158507 RepID=A0A0S2LNC3_9CHLO|nr:hypothetical chloroplast RF1 [Oogamochlamys gigantea]ALO62825.1 hypothetical chloroplast RF1 [Oogamochlamys gigantea]